MDQNNNINIADQQEKERLIQQYTKKINDIERQLADPALDEEKRADLKVELFYDKWWIEKIVQKKYDA